MSSMLPGWQKSKDLGDMMAKTPNPPCSPGEIYDVNITDLNHRGEGVGKLAGYTLFIPLALPGERAHVKIIATRKKYAQAGLLSIDKSSPHRAKPPCSYYPQCGGCRLQHLDYKQQLDWKQERVAETIRRIAGEEPHIEPVRGMNNPFNYRNKAEIHFEQVKGKVKAGFYEPFSHDIVDIESCPVQHPSNNRLIKALRLAARDFTCGTFTGNGSSKLPFQRAIIRSSFASGASLLALAGPESHKASSAAEMKQLASLAEMIRTYSGASLEGIVFLPQKGSKNEEITLYGRPYLEENIAAFTFRISARSFFQVNTAQAEILFEKALSLAGSPRTLIDLYCGTGTFALYLAQTAGQVTGIDSDRSAINDARANARLNKSSNLEFVLGRSEDNPGLFLKGSKPKTFIINPPRKGCSDPLLQALAEAGPERIVYVSCNPATLARDLKSLHQKGYKARTINPVDMFPHTSHVETVCLLTNK